MKISFINYLANYKLYKYYVNNLQLVSYDYIVFFKLSYQSINGIIAGARAMVYMILILKKVDKYKKVRSLKLDGGRIF